MSTARCNVSRLAVAHGRDTARRALAETIVRCDGKLIHAAAAENIHRSHVYRLVHSLRLWSVVNRARAKRIQRERNERCTAPLPSAS